MDNGLAFTRAKCLTRKGALETLNIINNWGPIRYGKIKLFFRKNNDEDSKSPKKFIYEIADNYLNKILAEMMETKLIIQEQVESRGTPKYGYKTTHIGKELLQILPKKEPIFKFEYELYDKYSDIFDIIERSYCYKSWDEMEELYENKIIELRIREPERIR